MSRNLTDSKRERKPIAQINAIQQAYRQQRAVQKQGPQATRLAVVEGYLTLPINSLGPSGISPTVSDFIDIEAPDGSPIAVGSLVHTTFLFIGSLGGGSPYTIKNWDNTNSGYEHLTYDVWLPYALNTPSVGSNLLYDLATVQAYRVPDNKVRIGARATMTQGSLVSSPTLILYVFYQLRMTLGWSEDAP